MNREAYKKILIIMIICILLLANYIFYFTNIVYAAQEELASNAQIGEEIEYNVYFKDQNENKVNSIEASIQEGANVYVDIKVNGKGTFINPILSFADANFAINNFQNESVKQTNVEENKIYLNNLIYGQEVHLEIPIKFNKTDIINLDKFSKQIAAEISGNFKVAEDEEKEVKKALDITLNWTDEAKVEINQTVEKFIRNENSDILQIVINSNVVENRLPKETEKILLQLPTLNESFPKSIVVLHDGVKMENEMLEIKQQEGTLQINFENKANDKNEINWISTDEYTVILEYEHSSTIKEEINLNAKVYTKLYTKEGMGNENQEKVKLEEKGNIVSVEYINPEDLYKGYMYAKVQNTTDYNENIVFQISSLDNIENLQFYNVENSFVNAQNQNLQTDSVNIRQTKINKNEFLRIFGENGKIQIINPENEVIAEITKDTTLNSEEDFVINYDKEYTKLKFVFTNPIEEGEVHLKNSKYIKGETIYTKEELKTFNQLQSKFNLENNMISYDSKYEINLKDTEVQAKLEINNNNLSTLTENKNVQLVVTFLTNDNRYELYKNPIIKLEFPEEIEQINVNSIKKVFSDQMDIKSANLHEENGKKVIEIVCNGEQTKYSQNLTDQLQIIVDLDIVLNKTEPSKKSQINMIYTNENSQQNVYNYNLDVNIVSKYGVLIYNQLLDKTSGTPISESINEDINVGNIKIDENKKTISGKIVAINNYETELSDFVLTSKVPTIGEFTLNSVNLKTNIDTVLNDKVVTNNNFLVEYSKDAVNWTRRA